MSSDFIVCKVFCSSYYNSPLGYNKVSSSSWLSHYTNDNIKTEEGKVTHPKFFKFLGNKIVIFSLNVFLKGNLFQEVIDILNCGKTLLCHQETKLEIISVEHSDL